MAVAIFVQVKMQITLLAFSLSICNGAVFQVFPNAFSFVKEIEGLQVAKNAGGIFRAFQASVITREFVI